MNLTKKLVTSYAKAIFQNSTSFRNEQTEADAKNFELTEIIEKPTKNKKSIPNCYLIGEELSLLGTTFRASKSVEEFFKNPTYREQEKLQFLLTFFPGLSTTTKSFLKIITEKNHLFLLPEIDEEYSNLLLQLKKATTVNLITASILQPNYGQYLLNILKQLTKSNEIFLRISYNPNLLGGLILEYNSTSTDASLLKEFSLFFTETP